MNKSIIFTGKGKAELLDTELKKRPYSIHISHVTSPHLIIIQKQPVYPTVTARLERWRLLSF